MIGREGAPPKRINHSAKRKGGEDDLDTPISDRIMSQGKIDPMISTLYDDSIEGRRHAVQLADTLGQLTDQEHEDASFDISTEHEDFDQFRKDTYGQDDEPKYTGTDKAKKMRRDYLTRKPNVIERYLPEWKRLVLSRIKSLTPIYKRNNIPGVAPDRVEYIANQWYPGEINRALLYSRMGFDEDSGTPAGDEYDAINKELLHELSEYEENMVYMLEADGRIKIEENPYGQEYITVIPEPDEPTFTGMYPLVKKEGRLTRQHLRKLILQEMKAPWASLESEKWGERARGISDPFSRKTIMGLEEDDPASAKNLAISLGSKESDPHGSIDLEGLLVIEDLHQWVIPEIFQAMEHIAEDFIAFPGAIYNNIDEIPKAELDPYLQEAIESLGSPGAGIKDGGVLVTDWGLIRFYIKTQTTYEQLGYERDFLYVTEKVKEGIEHAMAQGWKV